MKVTRSLPKMLDAYLLEMKIKNIILMHETYTGTKKVPMSTFQLATTSFPFILTVDFLRASFLFFSAKYIR